MSQDFASLFARAKAGDTAAIDDLLARFEPQLRAVVRLRSGPVIRQKESASDLLQSVCREALRDLDDVECADEPAFRQWLCTIALHKILRKAEYYRAQKRDVAREVSPGPLDSDARMLDAYATICTPSQHAEAREEIERIENAIDALPAEQRDVIIEARLVGRSYREIAASTGRSEVAVRKLLSRACARLGLMLERP